MPPKILGPPLPPNLGCKNIKFSRLLHSTPHVSGTKRRIDKPKCKCQSTMCSIKVDLLSVTFDPETAEICSVISTRSIGGHYVSMIVVAICLVVVYFTVSTARCFVTMCTYIAVCSWWLSLAMIMPTSSGNGICHQQTGFTQMLMSQF